MRIRVLGLLVFAAAMAVDGNAQEPLVVPRLGHVQLAPPFADSKKVKSKSKAGDWVELARVRDFVAVLPSTPSTVCAVPLIRAQIPKGVDYSIVEVPVDKKFPDPMPKLVLPAPPCDTPATR